ncbi:MAG: radical SAM protein [bacterium]
MKLRTVFCDDGGKIYDHPELEMAGLDGPEPWPVGEADVVPVPRGTDFLMLPERSPVGIDPRTGEPVVFDEWEGKPAQGAAVFMAPAYTQTMRPAYRTRKGAPALPLFAYTALGFAEGQLWAAGLRVDPDPRQDPWRFNMNRVQKRIGKRLQQMGHNRLVQQLVRCALEYGCRAAQNFFLDRWEAPLPISIACNAQCVGCISLQSDGQFKASHERLDVPPTPEEVAEVALGHVQRVKQAVVSFGQGCEGEPLLMDDLLEECIRLVRNRTGDGTINLNTNGSLPEVVERLFRAGLDSIRVSLNSPRKELYDAYFKPRSYGLDAVFETLRIARMYGKFTSINLFVFPGITDTEPELEALTSLIDEVKPNMIQMRNLNIDPEVYLGSLPSDALGPGFGIRETMDRLRKRFPRLQFGYFNPPKERFAANRAPEW